MQRLRGFKCKRFKGLCLKFGKNTDKREKCTTFRYKIIICLILRKSPSINGKIHGKIPNK